MKSRILISSIVALSMCACVDANSPREVKDDFKSWALTPPMGWNSWDCFGPTVVESEVKQNAQRVDGSVRLRQRQCCRV